MACARQECRRIMHGGFHLCVCPRNLIRSTREYQVLQLKSRNTPCEFVWLSAVDHIHILSSGLKLLACNWSNWEVFKNGLCLCNDIHPHEPLSQASCSPNPRIRRLLFPVSESCETPSCAKSRIEEKKWRRFLWWLCLCNVLELVVDGDLLS